MKRIASILLLLVYACQPISAQCTHPDFDALVELYNVTNGDNWNDRSGWDEMTDPGLCDPCSWKGIKCEDNRVIQVFLNGNGLEGIIPDLDLPELKKLFLARNDLRGEIPNFSGLPNLEELYLNEIKPSGSIPDFSHIPKLKELDLSRNNFEGALIDFKNLPELRELNLRENNLSGALIDFKNLPKLVDLDLSLNDLTGNLVDFSNLPELENLRLAANELEGPLVNFTGLQNLEFFKIDNNNLTGPVPSFENCPEITYLNLSANPINDILPDFIDLSELLTFKCDNAGLYGAFPPFSENKKITTLSLSDNDLIGFIPDFTEHVNLFFLSVWENDLEGCYPVFEDLVELELFFFVPDGYRGNTRMPFFGNVSEYHDGGEQSGAPCGIPGYEKYRAIINEDCKCVLDKCEETHPDLPALMKIYHSTGGENWINNEGWKAAAEGYRCNPCSEEYGTFYGITCKGNRVECIDLDGSHTCDFNGFGGNNLTGTWPKVRMDRLKTLILDDNNLIGNIPDVSEMQLLNDFRVTNNNFTGEIPMFTENIELTTVRLSYNNLTGPLPSSKISRDIEFFTASENKLSGCFPEWVCNLEFFEATGNKAMPWQGDYSKFCDGVDQELAPCVDAVDTEGVIIGCYCCEMPQTDAQDHICIQSVYPNPARSDLYVSNIDEGRKCLVHNIEGKFVLEQSLNGGKINVAALSSGVYILSYQNLDAEYVTHKFVKL